MKAFVSIQKKNVYLLLYRVWSDQSVSAVLTISIEKSCFQLWRCTRVDAQYKNALISMYWKRITGCKTINPITQMKLNWYLFLYRTHDLYIQPNGTMFMSHSSNLYFKLGENTHIFAFEFIWPIRCHSTYFSSHNNNNNHRDGCRNVSAKCL